MGNDDDDEKKEDSYRANALLHNLLTADDPDLVAIEDHICMMTDMGYDVPSELRESFGHQSESSDEEDKAAHDAMVVLHSLLTKQEEEEADMAAIVNHIQTMLAAGQLDQEQVAYMIGAEVAQWICCCSDKAAEHLPGDEKDLRAGTRPLLVAASSDVNVMELD